MNDKTTDTKTPPTTTPATPTAPKTKDYVVAKTAIAPNGGRRSDLKQPGEVVSLTATQAKFYNGLGLIGPLIEDDEDADKK